VSIVSTSLWLPATRFSNLPTGSKIASVDAHLSLGIADRSSSPTGLLGEGGGMFKRVVGLSPGVEVSSFIYEGTRGAVMLLCEALFGNSALWE
jgi:hypothetical protein